MQLPNYFIRLTIQHKYQKELLQFLIKDILPDSIYLLGLHKSEYEHFHFLANYPNSIKELKTRFSQTSFRKQFGIAGLRNKINIKEHKQEDYKKTIHYVLDGVSHSNLKYYSNISDDEMNIIKQLDFPNKYEIKDNKITIRTLIRTLIRDIDNNMLLELHNNFNEEELLRLIIDKAILAMIENNISTKYQPLSEIILFEIIASLTTRTDDDYETLKAIRLYLSYFNSKLIKKISNLIL